MIEDCPSANAIATHRRLSQSIRIGTVGEVLVAIAVFAVLVVWMVL